MLISAQSSFYCRRLLYEESEGFFRDNNYLSIRYLPSCIHLSFMLSNNL